MGSLGQPFNTLSRALGAEATFAGRALDRDRKGLTEVLRAAAEHRGSSFVEILQDCPIFSDGSFDVLCKEDAENHLIRLAHGEPIRFGATEEQPEGQFCVVRDGFGLAVANTADVATDQIVVHDAYTDNPEYAYALSRLSDQNLDHVVTGIFRQVARPTYDDGARAQLTQAAQTRPVNADSLQNLFTGKETFRIRRSR
jgi:2-oxoglutarate ferredoxin oxidoreductase subunit beta